MPAIVIYNLKTALCIAVFYIFYKVLLDRETFHGLKRAVIILSVILSFLLPAGLLSIQRETPPQESYPAPLVAPQERALPAPSALPALSPPAHTPESPLPPAVAPDREQPTREESMDWIIAALFWSGAAITLLNRLASLLKVLSAVRGGERTKIGRHITLVKKEGDAIPFSWIKYIVISRCDYEDYADGIITHERAHLRLGHSWDLLLLDLAGCMQWFNPAIWLLRLEMRNIHEYEADRAVLQAGVDAKVYQRMLIKKAAGAGRYSIADSLNHSKLKNRITMMLQKESGPRARLKVLVMLPLAAIGLVAFASREYRSAPGKDSVKVATIINSHAQWLTPQGAEINKRVKIHEPESTPRYLAVDVEIIHKPYADADRPSMEVRLNGQDNMDAFFYIQPVEVPDRRVSDRRFFIDLKNQLREESVTFSDVSELVKRFAPDLYETIPAAVNSVPVSLTIRREGDSLSFETGIEGEQTAAPFIYSIDGTEVQYYSLNPRVAAIDIDAEGNVFLEGERVEIDSLYNAIKSKKNLTEDERGYINSYEVMAVINADGRAKFGTVKAVKERLYRSAPVFSLFADNDIPQTTVNSYLECSDSLLQYSVSGYLPGENYRRRPYYEAFTKDYYQTEDPAELRKNLIEFVITGDKVYANGEFTENDGIESKIREIAQRENKDVRKMIIGIKPQDDAEMDAIRKVRRAAYLMQPKWIAFVYLDGNSLFSISPDRIELPE